MTVHLLMTEAHPWIKRTAGCERSWDATARTAPTVRYSFAWRSQNAQSTCLIQVFAVCGSPTTGREVQRQCPFTMRTDEHSWKIIGTSVGTLDDRIKEVFKVAGVRRQHGDPITYLGRHFGTRLLQHAGGSSEGGAARRGHNNGTASFHYRPRCRLLEGP